MNPRTIAGKHVLHKSLQLPCLYVYFYCWATAGNNLIFVKLFLCFCRRASCSIIRLWKHLWQHLRDQPQWQQRLCTEWRGGRRRQEGVWRQGKLQGLSSRGPCSTAITRGTYLQYFLTWPIKRILDARQKITLFTYLFFLN